MAALTNNFLGPEGAIEIIQGETKELELHVSTLDGEEITDFDLTGTTIYLTVKCSLKSTENSLQLSSANPAQIAIDADPQIGLATIHFAPADTQNLAPGSYVFDVVVVSGSEHYYVLGPSDFKVLRGVTRL